MPASEKTSSQHLQNYITILEKLKQGEYSPHFHIAPSGDMKRLGLALKELAETLEQQRKEFIQFDRINAHINAGLLLEDILEQVYEGFLGIIPFNRIGFSQIEDHGKIVRARWEKSDQPEVHLKRGYAARLEGSSLQFILETGQPRIINDLLEYLNQKPNSKSTRLITAEGIRSSLTCPLIVHGKPVGFLYFSSIKPNTYRDIHATTFLRIASQLSVAVEKGRLVSELTEQKSSLEKQHQELRRLYAAQEEYLQQVARLIQAAQEVEDESFRPESLNAMTQRNDEIGTLARVFQNMAREIHGREERLKQQVRTLRVEIDQIAKAKDVKEITQSEYFQNLKSKAQQIRSGRFQTDLD